MKYKIRSAMPGITAIGFFLTITIYWFTLPQEDNQHVVKPAGPELHKALSDMERMLEANEKVIKELKEEESIQEIVDESR